MKRKSLLLMMLLALFSAGAWAQTPEIYTSYTWINGTTDNGHSRNLVDNDKNSKWCHLQTPTYAASPVSIIFQSNDLITPVGYVLTTGDDASSWPGRNPKTWTIEASNDQNNWDLLDSKTDYTGLPTTNKTDAEFTFTNTTAYRYFRFTVSNVMATYSEDDDWWVVQLDEFQFKVVPNGGGGSISYCTPSLSSTTTTYYISNFTTTGGSTNINNSTSGAGHSYSDFYDNYSLTAAAGSTINFTITIAGGSTHGSAIWVDWNNDGDFSDDGERVHHTSSYTPSPHSGSFTVPTDATAGDHRMRIVTDYLGSNPSDPCSASTGEFEDYKLTVSSDPYITLAPTAATVFTGFTQTLTATYGNVTGTPTITYTSSNTSVATVSGSGTTATVTAVAPGTATITARMNGSYTATCAITVEDPSYCTPAPTSVDNRGITQVVFTGTNTMTNTTHPSSAPYYGDYTNQICTVEAGETATLAITYATSYTYNTYIWVDLDDDYTFDNSEILYSGESSSSNPTTLTASITIPATTAIGNHRMRIGGADSGMSSGGNPCYSGTYGIFEDYTLNVIPASTEPSISLAPETATLHLGSTLTLTARVRNVSDPTITYTSSDNNIATVSGSGTTATVMSVAEGTVTITASMTVNGTTYTAASTITVVDVQLHDSDGNYMSWEEFTANIGNKTTQYYNKTVYLDKDITVSTMVPGDTWGNQSTNKAFRGTFDGQGHIITFNYTADEAHEDHVALFRYVNGATFKNLIISGTINSAKQYTAAMIGMAQNTVNIENCICTATINSTYSGNEAYNAGFIANGINTLNMKGCAFTGSITGSSAHKNGGFVGRHFYQSSSYKHTFTNCLFAPSSMTASTTNSGTFTTSTSEYDIFTNSYYTQSFGTEQGKQAYTITGGTGINVARSGNASNTYNASGITAYSTGITFTNNGVTTIYGAENDQLGLTLSGAEEYEADHGTLTGSGSNWTLTMEASNTVISAANTCPAPTQWYMPTWSVKGNTAKATLSWGVETGNTEEWQLCLNDGQQDHYYDVKVGYEDPNITEVSIQDAGTTVICTLINLTANTTYTAKVRTVCDATEEVYSSCVEGNFTTTPKTFQDNGDFNGQWNNPNNWTPYGVPGVEDVVIDEEANISDGVLAKANDITIGENGSITIEDGGQLWHNNDDVELTIKKTIIGYGHENASTNLGYQLFSSPVATEAEGEGAGLWSGNYNLYRFDSQANDEGPLEEWVVETSSIEPFVGYLYANEENTNITITGTVMGSSQSQTGDLVYNEGYRFGGWNLMGNPFVCNAYVSAGNNEEINYYVIEESDGRAEFVTANESNPIAPMGGLMVQATGEGQSITYSRTQPNKGSGILNMSVTKVLSNKGDALLDRARVRFGNGRNLEKFQLNPNHTKIYIPEDGKDYAVVYANGAGTIPVNFKAESNGRYNISFTTEEVGFNYLHLIDNRNGNDVDLLETPYYAFDAQSTDYASRFTLVFATGHNDGDDTFAFFNNGVWIINNPSTGSGAEATLQVVDVMGRVLSSETISGSCSKAINAAPGVYMLRLINGNDVKVQKVVVR